MSVSMCADLSFAMRRVSEWLTSQGQLSELEDISSESKTRSAGDLDEEEDLESRPISPFSIHKTELHNKMAEYFNNYKEWLSKACSKKDQKELAEKLFTQMHENVRPEFSYQKGADQNAELLMEKFNRIVDLLNEPLRCVHIDLVSSHVYSHSLGDEKIEELLEKAQEMNQMPLIQTMIELNKKNADLCAFIIFCYFSANEAGASDPRIGSANLVFNKFCKERISQIENPAIQKKRCEIS